MSNQKTGVTEVICVCSWSDATTWKKGAPYILRNIAAERYRLLVPDLEVEDFRKITPAAFEVLPESNYVAPISKLLDEKIPADRRGRKGWYLQQFIKMAAALAAEKDQTVLIWDADTIPLKPLDFVDPTGRIRYYKGVEHHLPYFGLIEQLLGLRKAVDFSFIAQCFPLRGQWLAELRAELERKYDVPWYEAIIARIDFSQSSGFSEYETIGTYIAHHHPDEISFYDGPWWRYGNRLVGDVDLLTERKARSLSRHYDFMSFEKWERRPRSLWFRKLIARAFPASA